MEKIILVDGNNLVFRSYYATAYTGNLMKNSKDFPTNAIFGFANMINKIVLEESPTYMIVAFDKGKTFRHVKYKDYKAGRSETPEELKIQMAKCKELLGYMGIKYYEMDNYEADDIIGTFAKFCDDDPNFIGTIISSDKDLLQLISPDVEMKLLKMKDYIRYNEKSFIEEWQINPKNIVDLKALMGDSSDNIPGVAGIGEKTALKLLIEYKTLDGIYENIDKIKGKLQEKLINDKENAYMSYELATIVKDAPVEISLQDIKMKSKDHEKLNEFYEEMEFYSFIKKEKLEVKKNIENIKIISNVDEIVLTKDSACYLELLGTNYHTSKILGMGVYNDSEAFFIPDNLIKESIKKLDKVKYTYDYKKMFVSFKWNNIEELDISYDAMIAAYLLDYNLKDDIAYLSNILGYDIEFYDNSFPIKKGIYEDIDIKHVAELCVNKARFIYETKDMFTNKLVEENMQELFYDIEMPLAKVLGKMEYNGVEVDQKELDNMGEELNIKLELLEKDIYNMAGTTFNISSPIQLGNILFDVLGLPHGKKNKNGYSTNADILEKLKGKHPIVEKVLEYRLISKLSTTYIEGLKKVILSDGKVHTIFTNTLTKTGRLSSIEPNLQNIPIRNEYGRLIRKCFIPSKDSIIISGDYSQIELRILAHMANVESLIEAFKNNIDIHTKTASDIFGVNELAVTKDMRRMAKAVNFGIIYGISSYGLSENIKISPKEAKEFIDKYLNTYPGIQEYMNKTIKQAHEDLFVTTMFNRKRKLDELQNKNFMIRSQAERMALNTPIQGTSADIIKKAMVNIDKRLAKENLKSKMIIQVHDELVFDALESEREEVIKVLTEEMENIIKLNVD